MQCREMKKYLILLFSACATVLAAQYGPQPPFTIEVEPVATTNPLPGLHSCAFAQSGSKWLFVGGRINGLHGFSTNDNFPVEYANTNIVVIDTASWQYYMATVNNLPQAIADPLTSTNMQFVQDGNYLYMTGGFGWDSVTNRYTTFPTLTAIHVNDMINAVMGSTSIAPHIRQLTDTNMRVCGGEMLKFNGHFYLFFGHDFRGRYSDPPVPTFTQVYNEQIRQFDLVDNGTTIQVTNYVAYTDTNNFHRRDLNVSPMLYPNGSFGAEVLSGVFRKNVDLPVLNPITFNGTTAVVDSSFDQLFNNYTCPILPVFDSVHGSNYTVLFGGMSLYDYNPQSGLPVYDSLVPFVADISCMMRDANGQHGQGILPATMPGLRGTNARFIPVHSAPYYSNDVLRLRNITNRLLVGYIAGGIRSDLPNRPNTTAVHDTIYRVYLTPDQLLLSAGNNSLKPSFLHIYPNPANDKLTVRIKLETADELQLDVFDVQGRVVRSERKSFAAAQTDYVISTAAFAPGFYKIRLSGKNVQATQSFGVMR